MKTEKLRKMITGVFPPMMTPFTEDQKVDYDAIRFNMELYNKTDIGGMMPLGSNGEFAAITDDESVKIVKTVADTIASGKTVMAGVGRESAYHTVEMAKRVADAGAQCVSVLTPHYFKGKMNFEALYMFYIYIADRSPVPTLVYNAPKFASDICTTPELIAKLAEHPNIIGMKDTSGEDIKIYTDATADKDFNVMAGSISKFMRGLENGACGGVLSAANYLPQECCEVQKLFDAGKHDEAVALADKIKNITNACSGKTGVSGSKACMTLLGFKGGYPRLPLLPVNDEQIAAAKAALVEAGYLK